MTKVMISCIFLVIIHSMALSSFASEPQILDEAVQSAKDLMKQGKSNREIAEHVSRVVDDRMDNANTPEGFWRRGPIDTAIKYYTGWELSEGIRTHNKFVAEREKIPGELPGRDYEARAKWAWDLRYGQCNEAASISYYILKEAGMKNVQILESPGHDYVVIGMDSNADPGDPRTWGNDAQVVDGWQGSAYDSNEAYRNKHIGKSGGSKPSEVTSGSDNPALYQKHLERQKRQAEEEVRRKAEEEKRKAEEEKLKIAAEEARRKAVEEAIKKAEKEKQKAEEERRKAEEEAIKRAEEEARRKMEEANKDETNKDVVGDNRGVGGPEGVDNPEGKPEVGPDELYTDEDSIKKLRGAEKKTAKLDKSKKKSAKGEKEGIELAKGINVTDSFDKERSGKSKNESQESQTGAGTTLSERSGASKSQHEREKGKIDAQGQETGRAISETHKEHTTAQQTAQQDRQTSIGTTIAKAVEGGLTSGVATGLDNFFGGVGRGAGQQTSSDIGIVKKSKQGQGPSPSGSNTTAGTGTESQTPPAQGTGSGTKTQDQPGPEVKPDNKDRGGSTGGTTAGSGKEKGGSSGVKSGSSRKATCKCDESSCGCNKPARICSLMDASECKTKTVIKTSPGTGTTTGTRTTSGTSATNPGSRPGRFSGGKTVGSFP